MKISFSLRAFVVYFLILGSLLWFTLDNAVERLNDGMRQSAESVMVDIAHMMATMVESELANQPSSKQQISTKSVSTLYENLNKRTVLAKIYQITKREVDTDIYITNKKGIVVFDSNNQALGEDYSQWRDVRLTLRGEYGARTSFIDQSRTEPDDEKIMVVAAPLVFKKDIVGVVSVVKSIKSLEGYLLTESMQLKRYGVLLLLAASIIGYIISMWFTASLNKIAKYANTMASGQHIRAPSFLDSRFDQLTGSLTHLRKQLDGKEYVEDYIHSLTHELKTPITSIRGAVELLGDEMPLQDRRKFLDNINTSNRRMARLVEKMLSLAKLEGLTELVNANDFDFQPTLKRLLRERGPIIQRRELQIHAPTQERLPLFGDQLLLSQAISNLLDNALDFCTHKGEITISVECNNLEYRIEVKNQGEPIPGYALDKIYDRFFSLPRPSQKNETESSADNKSTGLGLSFVKEIMKLHQGSVSLTNTDHGVTALLRWPHKAPKSDS